MIAIGAALMFCLLAVIAVIGFASKSRDVMQPVTGRAHAAVGATRSCCWGALPCCSSPWALDVPIDQLLVGGG